MSEATFDDDVQWLRHSHERGFRIAAELDRLRRKLDIARKYFVRIQHEGDGHSHWIASTALEAMRKAGEA